MVKLEPDWVATFTGLCNIESIGMDLDSSIKFNSLKGSWNLSLQVLGAARALSGNNYLPHREMDENEFLSDGFTIMMP